MNRNQARKDLRLQATLNASRPRTGGLALALTACSLVGLAGCADGSAPPTDDVGQVVAEIQQAPANARCIVITVTGGGSTVTRQFNVAPETTSVFTLTGLPVGTDTFTANAFAVSCAQVIASTPPTYVSNPIVATVSADAPISITLVMQLAGVGGMANVGVDFPKPSTGTITELPLPAMTTDPISIATGPDGNLWISGFSEITRLTLAGSGTVFELPAGSDPRTGIATGADGNLWFPEFVGNRIGRITTAGVITEFGLLPNLNSEPTGMAAGPDGAMWFCEETGRIGRSTLSGFVNEFTAPAGADPFRIVAGADGNLWFTEAGHGRVGRITPAGLITEFTPPSGAILEGIALGSDGNLWFAEPAGNRIGRIGPSGSIVEFAIPTPNTFPAGVAAGPDGNIWFTESVANQIGRITPLGVVTEFPVPTPNTGLFTGITSGPDGGIWFVEPNVNQVGRIQP
jgi:streptogramin lyase